MLRYDEVKVWSQNKCVQKVWEKEKNHATSWILTHNFLNASQVLYWLSCSLQRNFLYTFAFNLLCRGNGSMHELAVTNLE